MRAQLARVEVDLARADVLDHADAGDRVEGLVGELAVVGEADLDASSSPCSATRSRASEAWFSDSVMPVTCTPWREAACSAKLPQPQPTSSTRSPGCSPSFVQTSSSLVSCASSSVCAPREKIAQLYVIEASRKSLK